MVENVIDNPVELLVFFLIVLATLKILFAIANWLESRPVKEKKKEDKSSAKSQVVEEKSVAKTEEVKEKAVSIEVRKDASLTASSSYGNYLYDRFVEAPSVEDNVSKSKKFDGFLSEDEALDIKNRNIKIEVKDVEDISADYRKDDLYKKIEKMASQNVEAKEKMLQEFEQLPKSMKLLLIENIMQKM